MGDELRAQLAALERAEARLVAGTYGFSVASGDPIPDERLEAFPTAELTVEEERAKARLIRLVDAPDRRDDSAVAGVCGERQSGDVAVLRRLEAIAFDLDGGTLALEPARLTA